MPSQAELASEVNANGFAFLPSHLPKRTTGDAVALLGMIEKLTGFNEIQELTPKKAADSPPNIYSGNFGYAPFPFHTDLAHWYMPPRFLVLRCIEGAPDVKTHIIDSISIIRSVGEENLRRALVQPRRPIEGNRFLLHILEPCSLANSRFRWDTLFIVPSTDRSSRIFSAIKKCISEIKPLDFVLRRPGDTLIVDNWRMLHGRSAVHVSQCHRKIHRAYLSSLL
jgi:L-asparagine oxygenase